MGKLSESALRIGHCHNNEWLGQMSSEHPQHLLAVLVKTEHLVALELQLGALL